MGLVLFWVALPLFLKRCRPRCKWWSVEDARSCRGRLRRAVLDGWPASRCFTGVGMTWPTINSIINMCVIVNGLVKEGIPLRGGVGAEPLEDAWRAHFVRAQNRCRTPGAWYPFVGIWVPFLWLPREKDLFPDLGGGRPVILSGDAASVGAPRPQTGAVVHRRWRR